MSLFSKQDGRREEKLKVFFKKNNNNSLKQSQNIIFQILQENLNRSISNLRPLSLSSFECPQ